MDRNHWLEATGAREGKLALPCWEERKESTEAVVWEERRVQVQEQGIQALNLPDSQSLHPTPADLPGFPFFTQQGSGTYIGWAAGQYQSWNLFSMLPLNVSLNLTMKRSNYMCYTYCVFWLKENQMHITYMH